MDSSSVGGRATALFAARAPDDGVVPFSQRAAVANSCFHRNNIVGPLPPRSTFLPLLPSNCNCVAPLYVVRPRSVNRRHYPDGTQIRGQCQCAHSPHGFRRHRSARLPPPTLCACAPIPVASQLYRDIYTGIQRSQLVVVPAHSHSTTCRCLLSFALFSVLSTGRFTVRPFIVSADNRANHHHPPPYRHCR